MVNITNTRERLLEQGARIFAQKGYHKATTREICLAAQTNITAIHYYFKDKKGLYRAIFSEPFTNSLPHELEISILLEKPEHDALIYFFSTLLKPFVTQIASSKHPHPKPQMPHYLFELIHKLIKREQFEPTKLVDDLIAKPANAIHGPLNIFLCHKLNLIEIDDEIQRLGFAITGLGFSLMHPQHIVKHLAPSLIEKEGWFDEMLSRLADFATAIINSEISRRKNK